MGLEPRLGRERNEAPRALGKEIDGSARQTSIGPSARETLPHARQ